MTQFEDRLTVDLGALGATFARAADGGIDAVRTTAGAAIAWRPPAGGDVATAAALVRIPVECAHAIAKIEGDSDHSPAWKERQIAEARARAVAQFDTVAKNVNATIDKFIADDATAATCPPITAGDHVSASLDSECRAYVRGMTRDEHAALARALLDGKHPAILRALLRSPIPLPDVLSRAVPEAWSNAEARRDPHTARQRAEAKEGNEWLAMIRDQARAAIPRDLRESVTVTLGKD